jgi:tetratricopeptide (TPR) repeat protein
MQPSSPAPPTPGDAATAAAGWRARVDEVTSRAAAAIAAGSLRELGSLFDELDRWQDEQRAYQARCRIAETTLAYRPAQAQLWPPVFATTARCLLDALEKQPREPVLLNLTGVLLYELSENAGAEALFRAAIRLDPDLDHAAANLEAPSARRFACSASGRGRWRPGPSRRAG